MLDKSSVTLLLGSGLSYLLYSVYSGTKGYLACIVVVVVCVTYNCSLIILYTL